jgi:hypothetical protein
MVTERLHYCTPPRSEEGWPSAMPAFFYFRCAERSVMRGEVRYADMREGLRRATSRYFATVPTRGP